MPIFRSVCVSLTLLFVGVTSFASDSTVLRTEPGRNDKSTDPVEQLVAQLGSDDYIKRREAEAELLQLGAAAFDYLQEAQSNPDLEIALQSQYLLYRVPIDWVRPDDPAEVRELMANYSRVNLRQRREIVAHLATLADGMGLAALSRISHYDMSPVTAKYAALGVLNNHEIHAKSARGAAETISAEIGASRRDAARWLRLYAAQLENLEHVDSVWNALTAEEIALFGDERRRTSSRLVLGLLQFQIELSQSLADNQALFEALKGKIQFLNSQVRNSEANTSRIVSRMLDKQDISVLDSRSLSYSRWIENDALLRHVLTSERDPVSGNIALTLSWVIDNRQWDVLPLLERQFAKEIKGDRLLMYLVAASRSAADRPEEAKELANRAYELVAFDVGDRSQMADVIADLGYHDWAEREWRYVVDEVPITSAESMVARRSIANWCLHDRGEDKAAADLLGEVCDTVDNSRDAKSAVLNDDTARFYLKALRTQREYFLACHLESQGDYQAQQEHLEAAYRLDDEDPDVLIAMFRLKDADDIYRERVAGRIRRAVEKVEQRIESDSEEPMWYNHYAWLVSNTEGDYDKAVRYSLKSLEIAPNTPSYLDTLGRCYYAAGDLKNAIKYQRRAVAMHPKVNVMRKQLEMFEKALAEKTK